MANFMQNNVEVLFTIILILEGFRNLLIATNYLKKYRGILTKKKQEKEVQQRQKYYHKTIEVNREEIQIEILLPCDSDFSVEPKNDFLTCLYKSVQSMINTGSIVSKVIITEISEMEAVCKYYDLSGGELLRKKISAMARNNAYAIGQDYLEQLVKRGNYDPRIIETIKKNFDEHDKKQS